MNIIVSSPLRPDKKQIRGNDLAICRNNIHRLSTVTIYVAALHLQAMLYAYLSGLHKLQMIIVIVAEIPTHPINKNTI